MKTTKRPFEIEFSDVNEVRMGSPYNHCHIQLLGTNIELPKAGWQDKFAWTDDSKRLVLVKWNFENNEPGFHLFLIDTEKGTTLESPKIFGLLDHVILKGDAVTIKKFLHDNTKSRADSFFDEEYQFHW